MKITTKHSFVHKVHPFNNLYFDEAQMETKVLQSKKLCIWYSNVNVNTFFHVFILFLFKQSPGISWLFLGWSAP